MNIGNVKSQLIYQLRNVIVRPYPYPHFHCPELFSDAFYSQIMDRMPDPESYVPIASSGTVQVSEDKKDTYNARGIISLRDDRGRIEPGHQDFWRGIYEIFASSEFITSMLNIFPAQCSSRFGTTQQNFRSEVLLMRDGVKYAIGPHSDQIRSVVVLLVYLPKNDHLSHLGTSVYVPKDINFTCPGGPHYDPDLFDRVHTFPFLPNSGCGFFKTNNSFHGVETVTGSDEIRDLMQISVMLMD